jgi:hypothetical protein
VPDALNAGAMNHPILAKQPSGFTPLAADAVKQAVLIAFLAGQNSVFMPDANNATPAAISRGHSLAELSVSIKCFLNDCAHDSHIRFNGTPRLASSFNTRRSE